MSFEPSFKVLFLLFAAISLTHYIFRTHEDGTIEFISNGDIL